jgi:hypothetical protein
MALIGEFEVAVREVDPTEEPDQFRFCGEVFTVGQVGLIPLGKFAKAAVSGLDSSDMEGLAAMIDMLTDTVVDEDRGRFLDTAQRNRAKADDLMPIIMAIIQAEAARPTQRPSDSSGGPSRTGASSRASSSSVAPILRDPRVQGLVPVDAAAMSLVG